MCNPRYEVCSCDQSLYLREALERAWVELAGQGQMGTAADEIITKALDTDHAATLHYIEESE